MSGLSSRSSTSVCQYLSVCLSSSYLPVIVLPVSSSYLPVIVLSVIVLPVCPLMHTNQCPACQSLRLSLCPSVLTSRPPVRCRGVRRVHRRVVRQRHPRPLHRRDGRGGDRLRLPRHHPHPLLLPAGGRRPRTGQLYPLPPPSLVQVTVYFRNSAYTSKLDPSA